jgi:hypothetical protein
MSQSEEEKLVDEIDREYSRKDSLVALVVCLGLGGCLFVAAAMNVMAAV